MVLTAEEEIEQVSKQVESFKELKSIVFHQDYVIKHQLIPALNRLPSDIKETTLEQFNHYFKTNKNIISYLWKEGMILKKIVSMLESDDEIKEKVNELREELESGGEE